MKKIISSPATGGQVSPAVAFLAETINAITRVDSNGDGRVVGLEVLDLGQKLAFAAFRNFAGFQLADFRAELRQVLADPVQRQVLIEVFRQKFDLQNDLIEFLIEDTLEWLDRTVVLVARWSLVAKPRDTEAA